MAKNTEQQLKEVCAALTKVYQDVITQKKLVKTGTLLKSIKWIYTKKDGNIQLSMSSKNYFADLDKKYGISKAVRETKEYKESIAKASAILVELQKEKILKELNGDDSNRDSG